MTTDGDRGTRRVVALAGVLMAVAAIVVFVSGSDAGSDAGEAPAPQTVPEGGSRFGGGTEPAGGDRADGGGGGRTAALERRVAELFVAGFTAGDGPQRPWGGLLLTAENGSSPDRLRALTDRLARQARRADRPPPLIVADPAGFPDLGPADQPTIGAEGTQRDARTTALLAGRRLREAGVDVVLAPSADLGVEGTPAELRSFGDDPRTVAAYVFQAVDGWLAAGVAPVPGRFPGEGAASQDPIEGPATVGLPLDVLVARDVRPFAGVVAQAPAIQMSAALYVAWDGITPATLLPEAVALLRDRLGFDKAVLSADLIAATAATGEGVGAAAVQALRAGCDMLLVPGGRAEQDEAYEAVRRALRDGELDAARVEQALGRVEALRRAPRR